MTEPVHRLTRRDLFRLGLAAGPAALVAACGWDGGPVLEPWLRTFSRINDWAGERILLSPRRLAREYPVEARTPPLDFPSYSITYNRTGGFPAPDQPEKWVLEVGGSVKHHCVEGWTAIGSWTGVPVSAVADMAQPKAEAAFLRFDSFDSDYYNGWDLTSAMHAQTILAYAHNDQPLSAMKGAPLRLYSPIKLGYKMTKYLTAMTFTRTRPGGYWEDQGYPWLGGV
jgi:DMSO/TMAO reductase YedYZ molybdopterin-dependent catalytic subunit